MKFGKYFILMIISGFGCQATDSKPEKGDERKYVAEPFLLTELGSLPNHSTLTLIPITRQQSLGIALSNGRIENETFQSLMSVGYYTNLRTKTNPNRHAAPSSFEPPMEILRLTENMCRLVDQDYWILRASYCVYLWRYTAFQKASELETIARDQLANRQINSNEYERTHQLRLTAESQLQVALYGGIEKYGLISTEAKFRKTIGYIEQCGKLLLPSDPILDLEILQPNPSYFEQAKHHRLELVSSLSRLIACETEVDTATEDELEAAHKKLEQSKGQLCEAEKVVAFEISNAMQELNSSIQVLSISQEQLHSISRQLNNSKQLLLKGESTSLEHAELELQYIDAVTRYYQNVTECVLARTQFDRSIGQLLIRDGVQLPSSNKDEPPQPTIPLPITNALDGIQIINKISFEELLKIDFTQTIPILHYNGS